MACGSLMTPRLLKVGRSKLRQDQSATLASAKGNTVVIVTSVGDGDEKCVLDREYFDGLLRQLRSAIATLEVTADSKILSQVLSVAKTIDEDIRLGKLHSFEEAFEDEEA